MAKDPAFLFYPNDWLGGTHGMTLEEKGAYMEVLILQFNRGHMEGHMIGQIIGQIWDKIQNKFTKDDNGLWFNARLEEEIVKRKTYSLSRRNNLKGKNQYSNNLAHMDGHMTSHMENENENENINIDSNINTINNKKKIKKVDIYRSLLHLTITKAEVEKLKATYSITKIDQTLDAIENYRNNKNYTSLYLTCKKWLEKEQNNKTQMVY